MLLPSQKLRHFVDCQQRWDLGQRLRYNRNLVPSRSAKILCRDRPSGCSPSSRRSALRVHDDRIIHHRSPTSAQNVDSRARYSINRRIQRNRRFLGSSVTCHRLAERLYETLLMTAGCSVYPSFPRDRKFASGRTRRMACQRQSQQYVRRHRVRCHHCIPTWYQVESLGLFHQA